MAVGTVTQNPGASIGLQSYVQNAVQGAWQRCPPNRIRSPARSASWARVAAWIAAASCVPLREDVGKRLPNDGVEFRVHAGMKARSKANEKPARAQPCGSKKLEPPGQPNAPTSTPPKLDGHSRIGTDKGQEPVSVSLPSSLPASVGGRRSTTWSMRPNSLASCGVMNLSRSMASSMTPGVWPVCLA